MIKEFKRFDFKNFKFVLKVLIVFKVKWSIFKLSFDNEFEEPIFKVISEIGKDSGKVRSWLNWEPNDKYLTFELKICFND